MLGIPFHSRSVSAISRDWERVEGIFREPSGDPRGCWRPVRALRRRKPFQYQGLSKVEWYVVLGIDRVQPLGGVSLHTRMEPAHLVYV